MRKRSKSLRKMYDRLERIMLNNDEARRNKYYAYVLILVEDLPLELLTPEVAEVFSKIAQMKASPYETVGRAWRKVKQAHPEWYTIEQQLETKMQEKDVKEQLRLDF